MPGYVVFKRKVIKQVRYRATICAYTILCGIQIQNSTSAGNNASVVLRLPEALNYRSRLQDFWVHKISRSVENSPFLPKVLEIIYFSNRSGGDACLSVGPLTGHWFAPRVQCFLSCCPRRVLKFEYSRNKIN